METISTHADVVAEEFAGWELAHQEHLLQKLVDLNYQRGLKILSEKIRKRLAAQDKLDQSVDEIFPEWREYGRPLLPMTIVEEWLAFDANKFVRSSIILQDQRPCCGCSTRWQTLGSPVTLASKIETKRPQDGPSSNPTSSQSISPRDHFSNQVSCMS